ncbi:MAG: hypothetical protein PHC51_04240 [bacterium]|nr:hypothetical protein [bacterium]
MSKRRAGAPFIPATKPINATTLEVADGAVRVVQIQPTAKAQPTAAKIPEVSQPASFMSPPSGTTVFSPAELERFRSRSPEVQQVLVDEIQSSLANPRREIAIPLVTPVQKVIPKDRQEYSSSVVSGDAVPPVEQTEPARESSGKAMVGKADAPMISSGVPRLNLSDISQAGVKLSAREGTKIKREVATPEVSSAVEEVDDYDTAEESEKKRSSLGWMILTVIFGVISAVGYYTFMMPAPEVHYTKEELKLFWVSGIPSDLVKIIGVAVRPDSELASYAEGLIRRSILAQDSRKDPRGFLGDVIRITYNPAWELKLSDLDRRAALIYSALPIAESTIPRDVIPSISSLGPEVQLAISLSYPTMTKTLQEIPASNFIKLPAPIGLGMRSLVALRPDLTAADPIVQKFAKIAINGFRDPIELSDFVNLDVEAALLALAGLYRGDDEHSGQVMQILFEHPNIHFADKLIEWGKEVSIIKWKGVTPSVELQILAGLTPEGNIPDVLIRYLSSHPVAGIRAYALTRAINVAKFFHPAAYAVLRRLSDEPTLLSGEETLKLAEFLGDQQNQKKADVLRWIATSPSEEILGLIVVGSSSLKEITLLDFEAFRLLRSSGWQPNKEQIDKLSGNPEKFIRIFAITQAYKSMSRDEQVEFFNQRLSKERDPELQVQLKTMLGSL